MIHQKVEVMKQNERSRLMKKSSQCDILSMTRLEQKHRQGLEQKLKREKMSKKNILGEEEI